MGKISALEQTAGENFPEKAKKHPKTPEKRVLVEITWCIQNPAIQEKEKENNPAQRKLPTAKKIKQHSLN